MGDVPRRSRSTARVRPWVYAKRYTPLALLLVVLALPLVATPTHGQPPPPNEYQLFYDALGRLVGVLTPTGEMAIWVYDAVGNLLRIERYGPGTVSVFAFRPAVGPVGTSVTIGGANFSAVPSENAVTFNGVPATVTAASPTELVAIVPLDGATGPITVSAPRGSATSAMAFTVPPPIITAVQPTTGVTGSAVTLSGSGFNPDAGRNTVTFAGGRTAAITAAEPTRLDVRVPLGAHSGPIQVTTPQGSATSAQAFTIPPPVITGLSPTSTPEGTTVTLTGTGFTPAPAENTVAFDGVVGTVTAATSTEVVAVVPIGAGSGPVTLTTRGETATSPVGFLVPLPQIASFTPTSGPEGGTVSITGVSFSPLVAADTVRFNGVPAAVTAATTTRLDVVVPFGATTGPISVTTAGGTMTTSTHFVVTTALAITSVTPLAGPEGTPVTLTGFAFSPLPPENQVTFNGVSAVVTDATETRLVTSVPLGATSGPIVVTARGRTATAPFPFTVPAPFVLGFNPGIGPEGGAVTIFGVNFSSILAANSVRFNGVTAVISSASPTALGVTVPVGATTGLVTVTTAGGTGTSSTAFVVVPVPIITGFSPTSGAPGTAVTITGTGFQPVPADDVVTFNGVRATVRTATAIQLEVNVPDGATTGPIAVTTAGGTATSAEVFTIVGQAAVTSVDPPAVVRGLATRVTFTATTDLTGAQVSTTHPYVGLSDVQIAGTTLSALITPGLRAPLQPFAVDLVLPAVVLRATVGLRGIAVAPAAALAGRGPIAGRITGVGVDFTGGAVSTDSPLVTVGDVQVSPAEIALTLTVDAAAPSADVRVRVDTPGGVRHEVLFAVVNPGREPRLMVASVFPPPGTPSAPPEGAIRVRLTEAVDPASVTPATVRVTQNGAPVSGVLSLDAGATTLTFTPAAPFLSGSIVAVTLTPLLRSQAGELLSEETTSGFTTAAVELFVNPAGGNDTTGDGSAARPFATIGRALGVATAGTLVRVAAGTYAEAPTVPSGVTLLGAGAGLAVVDGTGLPTVAVVTARATTAVLGLTVRNGQTGVLVDAPPVSVGAVALTGQPTAGVRLSLPFGAVRAGDVVLMDSVVQPGQFGEGFLVQAFGTARLDGAIRIGATTITTAAGGGATGIKVGATVTGAIRLVGNVITQAAGPGDEGFSFCCEFRGPITVVGNTLNTTGFSGICCRVPASITVSHNVLNGPRGRALDLATFTGAPGGAIRVVGNAILGGLDDGISVCCDSSGMPMTVTGNQVESADTTISVFGSAVTVAANAVTGSLDAGAGGDGDFVVLGNVVSQPFHVEVDVFEKTPAWRILVVDNRVDGSRSTFRPGLALFVESVGVATVADNRVTGGQFDGIYLRLTPPGVLVFERNVVESAAGIGLDLDLTVPGGSAALLRANRVAGSGSAGVSIRVGSQTAVPAVLRENVISGSAGHGVHLPPDFGFGSSVTPDLGTAADPGGNVLTGNGTADPSRFFDLTNELAHPVTAIGNRWDHGTAADIDRFDVFDDEEGAAEGRTLGTVMFEPFVMP